MPTSSSEESTESGAIFRIRSVMRAQRISIRQLSKDTAIPYRSLQNYFSGIHSMPIDVLQKICSTLGVSADWVLYGIVKLSVGLLAKSIDYSIGNILVEPSFDEEGNLGFSHADPTHVVLTGAERWRTVQTAAILISSAYDIFLESKSQTFLESRAQRTTQPETRDEQIEAEHTTKKKKVKKSAKRKPSSY